MRVMLLLVLIWPAWVSAADIDDFVLGMFSLERCGFMSASETARADRVDLCRDLLGEVDSVFDSLEEQEPAELMDALRPEWERLVDTYEQALEDPFEFRNYYTADDIRTTRAALADLLGDRLPKPPNPIALAVVVERAANEYVWRAESVMAGGLTSSEVLDIEVLVREMDKQFEVLNKEHPDDLALKQAYTKYEFIRGSLLNYNSDTVPFLVDRYADMITESLSQVVRR